MHILIKRQIRSISLTDMMPNTDCLEGSCMHALHHNASVLSSSPACIVALHFTHSSTSTDQEFSISLEQDEMKHSSDLSSMQSAQTRTHCT